MVNVSSSLLETDDPHELSTIDHRLSTIDWLSRKGRRTMATLVFCDIEGTLIDGSLTHSFVQAGRRLRVFSSTQLLGAQFYALLSVAAPKRYSPGLRWRALLRLLAGQRRDEVERVGRAGMPDLRARFKPVILERLTAYQAE